MNKTQRIELREAVKKIRKSTKDCEDTVEKATKLALIGPKGYTQAGYATLVLTSQLRLIELSLGAIKQAAKAIDNLVNIYYHAIPGEKDAK